MIVSLSLGKPSDNFRVLQTAGSEMRPQGLAQVLRPWGLAPSGLRTRLSCPYSQSICCFSSAPLPQTWIFIFDCQPVGRPAHFWPFFGPKKTETTLPPAAQLASPSALHPKNSLTGINRPNQRRARIAAKNVWRDALLRGLSLSLRGP